MKSLKFAAAFIVTAVAWSALADTENFAKVDSYLYFMVQDNVPYDTTYVTSGGSPSYDYAKVSIDGGGSYLTLYSADGSLGTTEVAYDPGFGASGVAGFDSSQSFSSFLIELYSDAGEKQGWALIPYSKNAAYIKSDATAKFDGSNMYQVTSVIPEPTSGLLLLLGLSGLALRRRRASALA